MRKLFCPCQDTSWLLISCKLLYTVFLQLEMELIELSEADFGLETNAPIPTYNWGYSWRPSLL